MGIDEIEVARVRRLLGEAKGRGRRVFSTEAKDAARALANRAKASGTPLALLAHRLGLHAMTMCVRFDGNGPHFCPSGG